MLRRRTRATREPAVVRENALQGTPDWFPAHAPAHTIEGYASQPSVRAGEALELRVSSSEGAAYEVKVYRLGWYGGVGARLLLETPPGQARRAEARPIPEPDEHGMARADWPVTDLIHAGEEWVSGQYVAVLVLADGEHAGRAAMVPFVVRRNARDEPAAALVQMPTNTAQAYNNWGGKSLYTSNSTDNVSAVRVSYDRPYPAWDRANLNARWPFVWDIQLLRFLEREGIDVEYATDVDTHREPGTLLEHALLITSGHDEYWSLSMRDAFDAAQAAGVNLACMGANSAYWNIRHEDDERTIVEYRYGHLDPETDRSRRTVRFRDLEPSRPECRLLGVQYQEGLAKNDDPPRHYTVVPDALRHPWMRRTGFRGGDVLPGLVGYEWDGLMVGDERPGHTVFLHCEDDLANADAVAFTAESGAVVFAAGSLQFSWGLDSWGDHGREDRRLQQFMRNALQDLLVDRRGAAQHAAEMRAATPPAAPPPIVMPRGGIPELKDVAIHARPATVWAAHAEALARAAAGTSDVIAEGDATYRADPGDYFHVSASALVGVVRALAAVGCEAPAHILDAQCGFGRVTRSLRAAWPDAALSVADASSDAVTFCAAEFGATPRHLSGGPVALDAVPDDAFDVIWAGTLLSSVAPDHLDAVLAALLRRLRVNGVLVGAFHGRDSMNRFAETGSQELRALAQTAATEGEAFAPDARGHLGLFTTRPERAVARLAAHREAMVVLYDERGWADHLDVYAVARKHIHHPQGSRTLA